VADLRLGKQMLNDVLGENGSACYKLSLGRPFSEDGIASADLVDC
jgi:hypothetical protein